MLLLVVVAVEQDGIARAGMEVMTAMKKRMIMKRDVVVK